MRRLADSLFRLGSVLRRVIGAPEYERYVAHLHLAHPDITPLTHEQFVQEAMARRYGRGGGRCC